MRHGNPFKGHAAVSVDEIPDLLRKLHTELQRTQSLDPESRRLLSVLLHDFSKFDSHVFTARDLAVRFEAEHPGIAAALRQLVDVFNKAGV